MISLGTSEPESYAAIISGSIGLVTIAILRDMGAYLKKPMSLQMDATAGLGVAPKRGAIRILHSNNPTLWLKCAVQDGRIRTTKCPSKTNPADLGTKYVERTDIDQTLKTCSFNRLGGRSALALRASV